MSAETKRRASDIMADVYALVATFDGISAADAMKLGALVQEYGSATAGELVGPMVTGLLDAALKPREPKKPWETL